MARRSEHNQTQIKEMVVNAAESIIAEEGVKALTVRKIAMEIGYTVGSIYMVFSNMPELLMHIRVRAFEQVVEQLYARLSNGGLEERIRELALTYLQFATENYHRWRLMFDHDLTGHAVLSELCQGKAGTVVMLFEALFLQLKPEKGEEQAKMVANVYWSSVHGICSLTLTDKYDETGRDKAETMLGMLTDTFIKGWLL